MFSPYAMYSASNFIAYNMPHFVHYNLFYFVSCLLFCYLKADRDKPPQVRNILKLLESPIVQYLDFLRIYLDAWIFISFDMVIKPINAYERLRVSCIICFIYYSY
jgi:hypothetical protein